MHFAYISKYFRRFDVAAANPLYEHFIDEIRKSGIPVATGIFGAEMKVDLVNDGPVTIMVER